MNDPSSETSPEPSLGANVSVERDDARHRYEILVDGERAGLAAYRDRGAQRVFHHTVVFDAFAGRGLAGRLVQQALTDTREAGLRIVPVCPYVAKYLVKHGEFADITDPVTPEVLTWLETELG
ncbi:GNAT family N-acetyltransferase [Streptomyces sp. NPDC048664]|uniref:GNAT family N-acetyltransferase n=1 Tax=Streptomyces sp. NPDC048664 TaxID=3154505 RepID=UPI003434D2CF